MDLTKIDELHAILNEFNELRSRLNRLDDILATDRNDQSKRNIAGFIISPTMYYSIYEQIKSEYLACYNELKSQIKQL